MARVVKASFTTSAPSIVLAPPSQTHNEVAFMGRSNVGKSSLINVLANHKGLAKSSGTPGKTRLINFFEITYMHHEQKYSASFVDLPGFGYAKVSKSLKKEWEKSLTDFISERQTIRLFVHLIDARHPQLAIDNDVDNFLALLVRPNQRILHVITKIDKLNQKEQSALKKLYPSALTVSSSKKSGVDKLNDEIFSILFKQESVA